MKPTITMPCEPPARRTRPRPRRVVVWIGLLGLAVLACGCTRYHDVDAFVHTPVPVVTATEYRMAPPDVVLIESKRVREINGHSEMIRTDGKITLPLLGTVMIAGKTPEEAAADLQKMARDYYNDADVTLRVVEYQSKLIYVWGQVSSPGPYPYDGTNTIFRALSEAHPTYLSDYGRVEVMRPGRNGAPTKRMTIDLDDMAKKGDMTFNAVLEEGDVIYVPANPLAAAGLALQQLLLPIQPAAQVVNGPAQIVESAYGKRAYGSRTSNP